LSAYKVETVIAVTDDTETGDEIDSGLYNELQTVNTLMQYCTRYCIFFAKFPMMNLTLM